MSRRPPVRLDPSKVKALARRLFEAAKARATLKPPRGIIALATGRGLRVSITASRTTSADYMPDARRILRAR